MYPIHVSIYSSTMDPSWVTTGLSFHWASRAVPLRFRCRRFFRFFRQLSGATPVTSLAALPGWQEVMGRVTWRKNDLLEPLEQTGISIFHGKITIFLWENYGKLWKITIFLWENYGKRWTITIFNGKPTKNYGKSPCINGKTHYFYGH